MKRGIVSINRNFFLAIVALVTISSFFVMPKNALADWNPSYIIQDDRFVAISMNQQQIQDFLSSKGGYLANYRETRNSYIGPNDNRPAINKLASQIIYEAAVDYGLNPQVILATLQKEQSLVTTGGYNEWGINWAMGYAVTDSGIIDACNGSCIGFAMQVDWGSWQLRWNMDRANDPATRYKVAPYYTGNTITIDGFSTYLGTGATASLYRYTPHFHGNQNFRLIFTQWFGSTSPLYKSPTDYKIYAIANSKKYLVPNLDVMVAFGFHKLIVNDVDQSYLDSFVDGGTLTSVGKKESDPYTTYLFDDGKRYKITSFQECTDWGIDCLNSNVNKTLPDELFNLTTQDIPLPPMMAFQGAVWKLEGGKKRRIIDPLIIDVLGGWGKVRWMKDINASQPQGKMLMANNNLVTFDGNPAVYLYDGDQLNPIPNLSVYYAWNFHNRQTRHFPQEYNANDPLPVGSNLPVFATDGVTTFLIDAGSKKPLTGQESQWPIGTPTPNAYYALSGLRTVGLTSVLASPGEAIFTVYGSNKYVYPTFNDLYGLGGDVKNITNVSSYTYSLLSFGGLHLAPGRLFKISGEDIVRVVNGSTSRIVPSPSYFSYFNLPTNDILTVDSTTAARYASEGSLSLVFKSIYSSYLATGVRYNINDTNKTNYGIQPADPILLHDAIINRLPYAGEITQFIKPNNPNDQNIYYVTGGEKKYVSSFPCLFGFGGTFSSVINVPYEFSDDIPNGNSVNC